MKLHAIPITLVLALSITSCNKSDKESEGGSIPPDNTVPSTSKHEELANEIMDTMKEFGTAVSTVTDLESANDASKKIGVIGDRFSKIADQLKHLDPPSKELKEAINERIEKRQRLIGEEFDKAFDTLPPEALHVLQKAFVEFFEKMNAAGKEFERHFYVEGQPGS